MIGELYDAPNQEVVGLDPPWVEGDGGGGAAAKTDGGLDGFTKPELLEHAQGLGLDVSESNTKAEIRQAIDEA